MCLTSLLSDPVFLSGPVFGRPARLTDMSVTNSQDHILVYLNVRDAFTEKIQKIIISGVPTTFSFFITLDEIRTIWINKTLSEVTLTHTIKYNTLKNVFTIQRSWKDEKPLTVRTLEEARKIMTEIDAFKIIPISQLDKGSRYRVRAKAKLSKMTLPFYLHYILIMASKWEFETDWHTIDFDY
ncbi:DUF4390 domain-containing protein [Desulfonema limicola]|uniref:DUF4390 domain-containing protein n=1 Tax=Desulfonema limicola TaxID=45656 RepID=UPI003B8385D2